MRGRESNEDRQFNDHKWKRTKSQQLSTKQCTEN
jgi:hypothetical protein